MPKQLIENGEITDPFQSFISKDKYSRWLDDLGRRETWEETVDRYCNYMAERMEKRHPGVYGKRFWTKTRKAILNLEVMPSMRGLMAAGPALNRSEMAVYNCSFVAFDDVRAFDELLFILSNSTGAGFSVEKEYTSQLPTIPETLTKVNHTVVVEDSKEGWASAYREFLEYLYNGQIPSLDITKVRSEGARLKTFGGTASGPQPFVNLIDFTIVKFQKAAGRKLTPLEVHDIACMIGDSIVSGGVRRSALISLSDLGDYDMSKAKSGNFRQSDGQRDLANNSAVYNSKPSVGQFLQEWGTIYESYSGERGIFNKESARKGVSAPRRDSSQIAGTNPCGEIFLRNAGLCNLTEVIIREDDDLDSLLDKVEIATALGTIQSTFTDFHYVRDIWKENAEEERLLGVSFTGIFNNTLTNGKDGKRALKNALTELRLHAINVNRDLAGKMGINQSAAITCVKPSGTVSKLACVPPGIHPWYSRYYFQTIRGNATSPMTQFLASEGVPSEPSRRKGKEESEVVFTFPVVTPEGSMNSSDLTAIEHLDLWLYYKKFWSEHNPSVTVYYREHEWLEIGAWVLEHWDEVGGLTFLPLDDHVYEQAPYQQTDEAGIKQFIAETNFPTSIDWSFLQFFETEDTTTGSQTLACTSGACDLVEIV